MSASCQVYVQLPGTFNLERLFANPSAVHCSMLAEDAIKSAIANYYTKNPNARTTDLSGTGAAMPDVKVEVEHTAGSPAPAV